MFGTAVRIYLTANAIIYLFFVVFSFPNGFAEGLGLVCFSMFFSLPSLFILLLCFLIIEKLKLDVVGCWLVLLLITALCAYVPLYWLQIDLDGLLNDDKTFTWLSFGSAYGSILLQSFWIHKYFKSFQSSNTLTHEND